uniref:Bacteriocin n=1 Tax=Synechococcus sp. PCC 9341 TaxID=2099386 RepID=A0A2P0ZGF7_9SYNE|nr:hypothetical protein [Synechococcus sp. PCC 9341]
MNHIKIHDLKESSNNSTVFSTDLIELKNEEQKQITGGLDPDSGALAIIGLGITAATIGAPFAAGFGLTVGFGILFRRYIP